MTMEMQTENSIDIVRQALTKGHGLEFLERLQKASQQNYDALTRSFGNDVIETPVDLVELAYYVLTSTWHARCIEIKSTTATSQGYQIKPHRKGGKADKADEIKEYLEEISGNGTTHNSFCSLLSVLGADLEGLGNFYVEVVRDGPGKPVEMYHVPAVTVKRRQQGGFYQLAYMGTSMSGAFDKMQPSLAQFDRPNKIEQGDRLFGGGYFSRVFFAEWGDAQGEENEMIQVKKYHTLSPFYGVPAWIAAIGAIMGDEAAEKWNLLFFRNNRIPRKMFKLLGMNPRDPNVEKLRDDIKTYFREVSQPHSMMVIASSNPEAKIEVDDLESQISEGSFLKYKDINRDEILAAHGVPPRMLGVISPGNLGGAGDAANQRKDFRDFTVSPLQKTLVQWVNQHILPAAGYEDYEVELNSFNLSDSADFDITSKAVRDNVRNGMMSINEARQKLDLPVIEEEWANQHFVAFGDHWMPLNAQALDEKQASASEDKKLNDALKLAKKAMQG